MNIDPATIQRLLAARGAFGRSSQPQTLEFKAGRMTCEGKTVTPDPRKGTLKIERESDGLIHFRWRPRPSSDGPEEVNVAFPSNQATFEGPIPECATGRVLLLRVKSADRKLFWWMQEPSEKKDKNIVDRVNALIRGEGGRGAASGADADASSLAQLLGLGGAGAGAGRQPSGPSAAQQAALEEQQLQAAIRASMQDSGPSTSSSQSAAAAPRSAADTGAAAAPSDSLLASIQAMMQQRQQVQPENMTREQFVNLYPHSLTQVLDAESVLEQVNDEDISELAQHLPDGVETRAQLEEHLRSPQLRQALRRFQGALTSSQMGSLMSQLGLPFTEMGLQGFFSSVQSQEARESSPDASGDAAAAPAGDGDAAAPSSGASGDQEQPPAAGDPSGKPPSSE